MTIAVACCLADGVVMGADSAITIHGTIESPNGPQSGVLKVYGDAEKLFPLFDLSVSIVTYGLAQLGKRTLQSFIREFENHYKEDATLPEWNLEQLSIKLWEFFRRKYIDIFSESVLQETGKNLDKISVDQLPQLGFMLGGFSPEQDLPELWEIIICEPSVERGVVRLREPGNFGSNWRGQIEGVRRFHKGFSFPELDRIIEIVLKHFNGEMSDEIHQQIIEVVQSAEYIIPFDGMPLQEGVDYVKFCLDIMINQTKFVIGAPTCGGNVRIAVIRQDHGVEFVANNQLTIH